MKFDVIIIGSGPAGYVAAIRAGQVGLKTAIIEKGKIGGMCLNWGCIPSKALIESAKLFRRISKDASKFGIDGVDKKNLSFNYSKAVKRADTIVTRLTSGVEFLLKKNGVEIIKGVAKITSKNTVTVENRSLEADNIIIATGANSPKPEKTIDVLVDVHELFTDREIPENIVVAGYDAVAVELAQLFETLGKKVTLVSSTDHLIPLADPYLFEYLKKTFKKEKIQIIYNTSLTDLIKGYANNKIEVNGASVKCEMLINASPRKAIIPAMDIDIEFNNDFIKTDEDCQTSVSQVYAVGDVNGKSRFAHIGSAQGMHVVNKIKGVKQKLDLKKYPINMYSIPEMAQIGFTEPELKEQGSDYKVSEFPLSANGKAMTEGTNEGFVRILSDNKYGEVLGVQIVAPHATDMIAEASAYIQLESTIYDIAQTVHAHPTISEVFMEAGFEAVDKAIHK